MAEYIDRRKLIENLAPILYEKGVVVNNTVSRIIYGIQCEDTADVVEREKIDKAIEEIKGQFYVLLKDEISIEESIEEIWWNNALAKTLEIIKRNIGE